MLAFFGGRPKQTQGLVTLATLYGEVWNPSDLYKIDMPQEMLEKQKEKAIKQAIKLLISNGVIKDTDISVA